MHVLHCFHDWMHIMHGLLRRVDLNLLLHSMPCTGTAA